MNQIYVLKDMKNCPFCGNNSVQCYWGISEGGISKGSKYFYCKCFYCGARGPWRYLVDETEEECEEKVIEMWNQRREISHSMEIKECLAKKKK